jgi:7,8-dihydropterin-6-yl-methyl-4-(beta-D-ribofuranosyl)aminobenzene 5'-phosphate synthase
MLFGSCNCLPAPAFSRRNFICGGGAGFVTALVGTLAGTGRTARAQALGSRVPVVDRLAVTIVTDTQVIKFIPTEKRNGLSIERRPAGNVRPDAPPRFDLVAEWGLSMHAQSQSGSEVRNVLIDFGYTPETLNNNLSVLHLDPAKIDAFVLSHGHYDHFGGLVGFLTANKGRLRRRLPFFVGGEDCFCTKGQHRRADPVTQSLAGPCELLPSHFERGYENNTPYARSGLQVVVGSDLAHLERCVFYEPVNITSCTASGLGLPPFDSDAP